MKRALEIVIISLISGIGVLFVLASISLYFFPQSTSINKFTSSFLPKIPVSVSETISEAINPSPEPLTGELILSGINRVRLLDEVQALKQDQALCPLAADLLAGNTLSPKKIRTVCENCNQIVSISFDRRTSLTQAIQYIENDATASAMIKNTKLNIVCLKNNDATVAFVAAWKSNPPSPAPMRTITEDELFQSLSDYRRAQNVSSLSLDEKLCEYARKRVQDHITMLNEHRPKDTYPVPDKYPLDAHDGFKKDADSGLVFDITGKQKIAENLAYWPTAQYGVHVIEWGWDSSTEGHRETQLSNDYNSVCISGKQGFFVAIFGQ